MDDERKRAIINKTYDSSKVTTLDDFLAYTQDIGSIAQAGSDALYGINQSKIAAPMPVNKDTQGFVFFTRPMLNMSKWNLLKNADFTSLLTTQPESIQRYVRCTLDPSLEQYGEPSVSCPMVDNRMAFIPLLSNTILKLSGWPDVVVPTFTSKSGLRKEQWAIADGTTEINETFDLDATFKNMADNPVNMLLSTWTNYQSNVFDGQLKPYAGFEARNEIDYTTRIYRIVMDRSERYVTQIACTIASFPINDPKGKSFDYDRTMQYMDQNKETNIRFKCMGAVYNNDIIIKWFNKASGYANPSLAAVVNSNFEPSNAHKYTKIPHELLPQFKHRGYPLINTNTYALEWWIDTNSKSYKAIVGALSPTSIAGITNK